MSGLIDRTPKQRGKATGQAPRRVPAAISPARSAAFELLDKLGTTSAHSDDLLHGPRLAGLSQADKDLAMTLVLGVVRWQIALDARLRTCLSRPDMILAEPVAIALRLGAFQVLHLERIPAHAALNESVELVREAGHGHAAGMVNAVLRALLRQPVPRKPLVEPLAAMAERWGHPLWLVSRWTAAYGRAAAEAICLYDQQPPAAAHFFAEDGDPTPSPDTAMPQMDVGSRLVAELAAAAQPGARRVWDCCAAPGGKTVVLGRRLPEAEILATDTKPVRLRRLEARLARELPAGRHKLLLADAAALPESEGRFDLILCDVPCSGTGTLARNPEIRHRLQPADLPRQAERQARILQGALGRLAPGGRLVYSTCSLEPEENEAVLDRVLDQVLDRVLREMPADRQLQPVPVAPLLESMQAAGRILANAPQIAQLSRGHALRTVPGNGFPGDGFFAAIFESK